MLLVDLHDSGTCPDFDPLARICARAHAAGRIWVALHDDVPVGFAHAEIVEAGAAHLEELDAVRARKARGDELDLVTRGSVRAREI